MKVNPFTTLLNTIKARLKMDCSTPGKAARKWAALLKHARDTTAQEEDPGNSEKPMHVSEGGHVELTAPSGDECPSKVWCLLTAVMSFDSGLEVLTVGESLCEGW